MGGTSCSIEGMLSRHL